MVCYFCLTIFAFRGGHTKISIMNVLLKSAKIVAPEQPEFHLKKRDILIREGKITSIASKIEDATVENISYKNLHVSLGWFDSSVCFGEPGYEERETIDHGLDVAAKSGFTDIVLNPNTKPSPNANSTIVFLKNRANHKLTGLHPLGNFTIDAKGVDLAELYDMKSAGAVAFYDYKRAIANPNLLKIGLLYAQNFDGLIYSFPMDVKIKGKGIVNEGKVSTTLGLKGIPALAEELQVSRDLFLLEYTGGKLHIPTISTAGSVKLIAAAKKKGLNVSCSVAVHNLILTDESLTEFETSYKVMPPLRTKKDVLALLKGLENGTIDLVTTDHTPIDIEQKKVEFDNAEYGSIGLESGFGLINQVMGMETAISLLTKGRSIYGIEEPEWKEGSNANLTLFNPEGEHVFNAEKIWSTSKNTAFLNTKIKGIVYGTINNNKYMKSL